MAAEGWVTISKRISAVSASKVTKSRWTFGVHIVDWHYHFCLSMQRFVPEICGVECGSHRKWSKIWRFLCPKFGRGPKILGAFVNRHQFWPTGQVWLRSHGWSFIYAEKKIKKYSGKIWRSHNEMTRRMGRDTLIEWTSAWIVSCKV